MTKALIVLAAVLSIVLATLTMAYTANADRVAQELAGARATARSAESALEAQTAESGAVIDAKEDRIQSLEMRLEDAKGRNAELQAVVTRVRGQVEDARLERDSFKDLFAVANEAKSTLSELLTSLVDENEALRESESRKRRELAELSDQFNNAESRNQVLNETVRTLRVTVAQLRERVQNAESADVASASGGGDSRATQDFTGAVRAVREASDSAETLVELDVGTNDSVSRNVKLFITRGNEWIADVRVVEAELNSSVARVTLTAEGKSIQQGDRVESQLQ